MGIYSPVVLVVEDEPEARLGLRYYLEAQGYNVLVAGDGEEGMKSYRESPIQPSVVVLDLRMSGKGGFAFLSGLKNEPRPPKVILLTALTGDTIEQAAQIYGVARLIHKPAPLPVVREAIEEVLKQP